MSVENFEAVTYDLQDVELNVILPMLVMGFKTKTKDIKTNFDH